MTAGIGLRVSFVIGAVGVLASVAGGALYHVVENGTPPPLMGHPLEPSRDALSATGGQQDFIAENRMLAAIQARDARAQVALANVLARSGDDAGAIEVLERTLGLSPVPPVARAMLATLYARNGRIPEAREQAGIALRQDYPVQPQLLHRLGMAAPSG